METARILLVDDDKNLLRVMAYHIRDAGFEVTPCSSPRAALQHLRDEGSDLVITDLRMPEMDGLELLDQIRRTQPELPVIVLTAHGTIDKAVEAVKRGASDFLSKPFEREEVKHAILKALQVAHLIEENRRLAQAVEAKFEFKGIVGSSKEFRKLIGMASQLADVDTTVLIQGESGTGKELLARAIHFNGARRNRPFVAVSCGAIPSDLMESELFGHKKGSFTGAIANRKGKFEIADTGTLFLDEVGELPLNMQVKLLRVIQEKEIDVIGSPHPQDVDVRIITATNRDLYRMVQESSFREDLYYRLAVAPLQIPPLRERREDIPLLIHHITSRLRERLGKEIFFTADSIEVMQKFDWPGNVRELENVIERVAVFSRTGTITQNELPPYLFMKTRTLGKVRIDLPDEGFSLEELEREIIRAALDRNDWNQTHAAQYLGMTRNTLVYRMQKYDLKRGNG